MKPAYKAGDPFLRMSREALDLSLRSGFKVVGRYAYFCPFSENRHEDIPCPFFRCLTEDGFNLLLRFLAVLQFSGQPLYALREESVSSIDPRPDFLGGGRRQIANHLFLSDDSRLSHGEAQSSHARPGIDSTVPQPVPPASLRSVLALRRSLSESLNKSNQQPRANSAGYSA